MQSRHHRSLRGSDKAVYAPVATADVPGGLTWKPREGRPSKTVKVELSMGGLYKRSTDTVTGTVTYWRLLTEQPAATPAEIIDVEPEPENHTLHGKRRYNVGVHCWFVDTDSKWYLCEVVARAPEPKVRITIRPVTGYDDTREKPWLYGDELEFPARPNNRLFQRLRPLCTRKA